MGTRRAQGGWAGLIVLLLALAIVAMLGKTVLRQMGVTGDAPATHATVKSGDTEVVVPAPTAALERARGLQDAVREQARENDARIDKVLSP